MCYSGKYTKKEMLKKIRGEGGLKSLLGTTDCREIEKRILNGDEYAKLVYEAEALQVAKGIGIMLACFEEKIDAVILTGGMAYSTMLTDLIKKRIDRLVPIEVVAGENEMEALALGTLRMLKGEEKVKELI
jgi:butyrate kinase